MVGTAAILTFALASCGEGAPGANDAADAAGENVQVRIADLPEGQRNGVFIRAIRDAREECQHVERSERSGENQGRPVWTAYCAGGGEYRIVVGDDGMAAVLNVAEATLVDDGQASNQAQ